MVYDNPFYTITKDPIKGPLKISIKNIKQRFAS